ADWSSNVCSSDRQGSAQLPGVLNGPMASVPRPAATAHSGAGGGATPAGSTAAQRDIHAHRILILDFGAQYTQLIARRVRELGVYCEIHPWDMSDAEARAYGARGVIR